MAAFFFAAEPAELAHVSKPLHWLPTYVMNAEDFRFYSLIREVKRKRPMTIQQIPIDQRAHILGEAVRLFRHYGYSKTTMADIAEACQMSPANLYRFFASKADLMDAICTQIMGEQEHQLYKIVHSGESASRRMERLVQQVYKHTLENLLDDKKVHEMVVVAMQERWHAVKAHLDRVCAMTEEIIKDGVRLGEFRPQDTARAARCAQSAMATLCHPVIVAQKLDDEERSTPEEIARFIINALKADT
jgi:AcrR family transcriptional regulator